MLISEVLSGDSSAAGSSLRRIERLVSKLEQAPSPEISPILEELHECLAGLKPEPQLPEEDKLQLWKLSYRIWNISVTLATSSSENASDKQARLRQIASDMLLAAGPIASIRSATLKMATFFLRTGSTWHKLRCFKPASSCYEKATEIIARRPQSENAPEDSKEEQQLMFDLSLARSRNAWELSQKVLASSLLGRAREYLSDRVERFQDLAEVYLHFGKSLLANEDLESKAESLRFAEQAYEICCEALKSSGCREKSEEQALTSQKLNILRYIAAGQLQNGNFEGVLKCVSVLKSSSDHPSAWFLAFKALVGLGRGEEAEKELVELVSHEKAVAPICVSALSFLIEKTQLLEAASRTFAALNSRFGPSGEVCCSLVEKVLKQASPGDSLGRKRVEVALSIAADESVLKRLGLRAGSSSALQLSRREIQSMHALLWNCGSDFFLAKDYATSVRLFEASMLYLPVEEESSLRAKALRVLCLCNLGLVQYDRAAEYVDAAEKLEPNVACSFLKLKICLQMNDEPGAVSQVNRMIKCPDFEPEYLTLASHEAVSCKCTRVAVAALSSMLTTMLFSPPSSSGKEATVFRNLIFLAMQDPKCQGEALKYLKLAQSRLVEAGSAKFLGSGSDAQREASWIAGCAWNQGLTAAKSHDWRSCAELFACASDFYALFPDVGDNLQCLETALLLTVAALLVVARESDSEELKLASVYLERCRKVHGALLSKSLGSNSTEFYLNLLAFDLKGRMKEHKEQLEIMYRCASLPGFKPEYLFQMAMQASSEASIGGNVEVPVAAFRSCLNLVLSSAAPDYKRAAVIMRKLVLLSDQRCRDGPEVLRVYREANNMLLGLKNGSYPPEEVQWLVSTAWNRAALQVKLSRFAAAEEWMGVALELLEYAPGMEAQRAGMMESLNEVVARKQKLNSPVNQDGMEE